MGKAYLAKYIYYLTNSNFFNPQSSFNSTFDNFLINRLFFLKKLLNYMTYESQKMIKKYNLK